MPPIQVVAQKVVQAGNPLIPTQGNYQASMHTSGIGPASGQLGALSGPFMIEEQNLTIDYVRVPEGTMSYADITLSSLVMGHTITKTGLACKITATYSRRKDDSFYELSSFQQPQKFEILSVSADASGNSYGLSGDAGHASGTLGPMGQIRTIQPWIRRRPWDQGGTGTDAEVIREVENVYNVAFYARAPYVSGIVPIQTALAPWDDPMLYFNDPFNAGCPLPALIPTAQESTPWLGKPGPYNYEQDTILDVPFLINTAADKIRSSSLFANLPTKVENPSIFGPFLIADQGFSEYDKNRHDYS